MKTHRELQEIAQEKWKNLSKKVVQNRASHWEIQKALFWMDVYFNMIQYTFKKAVAESIHNMKKGSVMYGENF